MVYQKADHKSGKSKSSRKGLLSGQQNESAADRIVKSLERDILMNRLKPRQRLVERDLVEQFSLSRSPIREALTHLESAGLITSAGKRGYVVRDYTSKEVLDLFYLREALERAAIKPVIENISDEQIANATKVNDHFREAFSERNLSKMIDLNNSFHQEILRSSGNNFLIESLENIRMKLFCCRYSVYLAKPVSEESVTDHEVMLVALSERDAKKYEEIVIAHMSAGKERYLEAEEFR